MVPSQEAVASRAYELWEEAGRPADSAQKFWFLAEMELESRFFAEEDNKPASLPTPKNGKKTARK